MGLGVKWKPYNILNFPQIKSDYDRLICQGIVDYNVTDSFPAEINRIRNNTVIIKYQSFAVSADSKMKKINNSFCGPEGRKTFAN